MKKITVLLLDAEQDPIGLTVIRCFGESPGVNLHIATKKKWAKSRFSRHVTAVHLIQPSNDAAVMIKEIRRVAEKVRPDVIMPIHEPTIALLAGREDELQDLARLSPLPDPQSFNTAVDKGELAFLMVKEGIPCPVTLDCAETLPPWPEVEKLGYPLMLKGRYGTGGETVCKIENGEELLTEFNRLTKAGNRCILQEYIRGFDICCNVLAENGEIKVYSIQKGIVNESKTFAYSLVYKFEQNEQVLDNARRLIKALNWTGVCHIDMRMDEKTGIPKVFEINARFWGSTFGSVLAGVNFPYLACLQGLGATLSIPSFHNEYYFTRGILGNPFKKEVWAAIRQGIPYSLRRTNFPAFLQDPLPEIIQALRWPGKMAKKGLLRLFGPVGPSP